MIPRKMKIVVKIIKRDAMSTMRYYACTSEKFTLVETMEELQDGKIYEMQGEYASYLFQADNVEKIEPGKDDKIEKEIEKFTYFEPPHLEPLNNAPSLKEMEGEFQRASQEIANAVLSMKQIKIRYDGDCDGICAGIMLKKAIESFAKQRGAPLFLRAQEANGAVYRDRDAEEDTSTLVEGSLLILLDHGANEESVYNVTEAAKTLEVMCIDHHPPAKKPALKVFVSPFALKNCEEPSSYNTALLVFELTRYFALELEKEIRPLCNISMQGDHSSFRLKEFFPEAVALDYLAVKADEPYSLEYYEKVSRDRHLSNELYHEEQMHMRNALEKTLRKSKEHTGKFALYICDASGLVKKNTYPSIGKLHNAVQNHYVEKNSNAPTATLLYTQDSLSFRANQEAAQVGFSANKVITILRKEFEKYGFSGGGHNVAASTRFPKDYAKEIIGIATQMVIEENGNETSK
ncbi:MAG: DHH family phosphoesterase [Candidatus Micrarchaeota archaeon]